MPDRITIGVRDSAGVTALRTRPQGSDSRIRFVYAPGAGSNVHDPFGAFLAKALAGEGIETWRFQFPYMEAGRRSPDATALLEATWRAVIERVRRRWPGRLFVGGRSMGGRIASHVVAQGVDVDGLVLFAYPLMPPGRNREARTAHLSSIGTPALFVSGTRDSFGTPDQLAKAAALIPGASLHLLDGADHGFSVLKASGRSKEDVWLEATAAALEFMTVSEQVLTPKG